MPNRSQTMKSGQIANRAYRRRRGRLLVILLFSAGMVCAQPAPPNPVPKKQSAQTRSFGPASYKGLRIGKSTLEDAGRLFKQPSHTFVGEDELEHWSYKSIDGSPGEVDVVGDPKTRILLYVTVYPIRLELKEFLVRFGPHCAIVRYAFDRCKSFGGTTPLYKSKTGELSIAECPGIGVSAYLAEDGIIQWIQYVPRAPGFEKSRCQQ
jgi:hypothetical protein